MHILTASQHERRFSGHSWKHQDAAGPDREEDAVLGQGRTAGTRVATTTLVSAGRSPGVKGLQAGRHVCSLPAMTHPPQILCICGEKPGGRLCLLWEQREPGHCQPWSPLTATGQGVPTLPHGQCGGGGGRLPTAPAPLLLSLVWGGGRQGQADSAGVGEGTVAPGLRSTYLRVIFRGESVG